jgi:hypothetical protein
MLKAWTVAEQLAKMRPSQDAQEAMVQTLFNCAIDMGHEIEGATSILKAAMAVGAVAPQRESANA